MTARDAAVAVGELLPSGPAVTFASARVTAVNVGPASVDLLVNDRWPVPRVRYLDGYSPSVGDAVDVLVYGSGKRVVLGTEAV